jgi:hypothetical protein
MQLVRDTRMLRRTEHTLCSGGAGSGALRATMGVPGAGRVRARTFRGASASRGSTFLLFFLNSQDDVSPHLPAGLRVSPLILYPPRS